MKLKFPISIAITIFLLYGCNTKITQTHLIAFYNLENLFDTINQAGVYDGEFSPKGSKKWNSEKYFSKLENMSFVISDMGKDQGINGPSVVGLCEMENKMVLEDLIHTNNLKDLGFEIIHKDSPDKRGIDVALLYQKNKVQIIDYKFFPLYIYDAKDNDRIFTRDQLLAKCIINKDTIHFIVNHWPSRYGGEERSIPHRIEAAKLNKHIIDSIIVTNPHAKIITMGDLNDNPTDESIVEYLKPKTNKENLTPYDLFNPTTNIFKENQGTLYYKGKWNLFDQMIMTGSLVNDSKGLHWDTTKVFNKPFLIEQEGKYKNYVKRTYGGDKFLNGYSDHLPVYTILKN